MTKPTAWQYGIKSARNLHAQGHATFIRQQLVDEALRLGWPKAPVTIGTHVTEHMRADRPSSAYPYLERLTRNVYRLNDAGRRAGEGL